MVLFSTWPYTHAEGVYTPLQVSSAKPMRLGGRDAGDLRRLGREPLVALGVPAPSPTVPPWRSSGRRGGGGERSARARDPEGVRGDDRRSRGGGVGYLRCGWGGGRVNGPNPGRGLDGGWAWGPLSGSVCRCRRVGVEHLVSRKTRGPGRRVSGPLGEGSRTFAWLAPRDAPTA